MATGDIAEVEYLTLLVNTPVPRDYPAKHLGKRTDKRLLVRDFMVRVVMEDGTKFLINVPRGYVMDGSTIPRVLHSAWHPFVTEAYWASVIHDYIYSDLYHRFTKAFADNLLKFMIRRDGGSWALSNIFYTGVRMNFKGGGWGR
jgi:hypothetical protein